jgi:hypothetical protein
MRYLAFKFRIFLGFSNTSKNIFSTYKNDLAYYSTGVAVVNLKVVGLAPVKISNAFEKK